MGLFHARKFRMRGTKVFLLPPIGVKIAQFCRAVGLFFTKPLMSEVTFSPDGFIPRFL